MKKMIHCRGFALELNRPLLMGVLNVTPDSFSDGGRFLEIQAALDHARRMIEEGADIIDIGGESTRPGSEPVSLEEELRRVIPVLEILVKETPVPISIDTIKPEVAEACFRLGVQMLNDVSGLRNEKMIEVAVRWGVPVVIMHMAGEPKVMQEKPSYENAVSEIKEYLRKQSEKAKTAGVKEIILDPGIGFGKLPEHNLSIIKHLSEFKELGLPVLVGPSRKSFIGKLLNLEVQDRLPGTLVAVAACVLNGADIVRVHDVLACRRAAMIADALRKAV